MGRELKCGEIEGGSRLPPLTLRVRLRCSKCFTVAHASAVDTKISSGELCRKGSQSVVVGFALFRCLSKNKGLVLELAS
jgi:hypothetical protein